MGAPGITFRELSQREMEALLARHHVGRIAFSAHDHVDIEPISYVYHEGALYGRTAHGTKMSVLVGHPWVAFEVDEVDGPFDWRSVVVKGTVYVAEPGQAPQVQEAYEHALGVLRTLMPDALTERDPAPERTIVFRLHIHEMTGRAAESKATHRESR